MILLAIGLATMTSCGEDNQAKVCECTAIYATNSAEMEKLEEEGLTISEALAKIAETENGKKAKACEEGIHKELGDAEFAKLSQECK